MERIFDEFIERLRCEIRNGLPGWEFQKRMVVPGRKTRISEIVKDVQPRISAVMLWLYPKEKQILLRLIVRTKAGDVHSGQVAFPGGSVEKTDKDLWHTALRESFEEIGLNESDVEFVGKLTPLYIPPSNFIVNPFIGAGKSEQPATISKNEVAEWFDINITLLTNNNLKEEMKIIRPENEFGFMTPCYNLDGHLVWGATAMILSEFEELLRRI